MYSTATRSLRGGFKDSDVELLGFHLWSVGWRGLRVVLAVALDIDDFHAYDGALHDVAIQS